MNVTIPDYGSKLLLRKNAAEVSDWAYEMYQFNKLHRLGYRGQGEVIAILDTGWNNQHPDLIDETQGKDKYKEGDTILHIEDFTGGDAIDRNFHSTWIHGALGATHNGFGVKGRCPEAKFIIMKILGDNGGGDILHTAKAIRKAVDLSLIHI